ncbi:hypothetical protein MBRA1_001557 [Malassezia brasiliensis]|uniref:VPS37 C-terminal domain-containing protein n=1 Tax=Malassezia brasiliensis TaxID=1821822 RepID=A0AAF0INB5_9BASI|nr:hypothetical protein MBRA1_001557 [Malassezia brasiliensis]
MDSARPSEASPLAHEFPRIAQLSRDELRELVETPANAHEARDQSAYLDALLHTLPDVRALYDEHEQLLHDVECAAAQNEQLRPVLLALRAQTRATYDEACAADAAWPAIEREMDEAYKVRILTLTKRFTPSALQTRLQLAMNEVHDESETLANAYVEGLPTSAAGDIIDDTTFVRQYRALRTLYHRRAMLLEQCARQRVQWHP